MGDYFNASLCFLLELLCYCFALGLTFIFSYSVDDFAHFMGGCPTGILLHEPEFEDICLI